MQQGQFRDLLKDAKRHSRRADEAEDLLQDAFVAAIAAGRDDLSVPENLRWVRGVLRHRSAFLARSAIRRRQREDVFVFSQSSTCLPAEIQDLARHIALLPRGLRITLLLVLNGQTHAEIRHLLKVNDAALRQRICEIRKRLRGAQIAGTMPERLSESLAFGSIRKSLRPLVLHFGASLAAHDPDGHLFCVGRNLTKRRAAAT